MSYSTPVFQNFTALIDRLTITKFNNKLEQCFNINGSLKAARMRDQDVVDIINFLRSIGIKNTIQYNRFNDQHNQYTQSLRNQEQVIDELKSIPQIKLQKKKPSDQYSKLDSESINKVFDIYTHELDGNEETFASINKRYRNAIDVVKSREEIELQNFKTNWLENNKDKKFTGEKFRDQLKQDINKASNKRPHRAEDYKQLYYQLLQDIPVQRPELFINEDIVYLTTDEHFEVDPYYYEELNETKESNEDFDNLENLDSLF